MRKLQYEMILYLGLFLIIFVEVGRASEEADSFNKLPKDKEKSKFKKVWNMVKRVCVCAKKKTKKGTKEDYLSKLRNDITTLILGYLEIPKCFKYLLLNKTYSANKHLRKFITERALQEYCVVLLTPDHPLPDYWNQLQYFPDSYLDSTIMFPDLPLILIGSKPSLRKTATEIVTYFRTEGKFKYLNKEFERITPGTRLPVFYDPKQSVLYIYPTLNYQCTISSRVRLPSLLVFKHLKNSPTYVWISEICVTHWEWVWGYTKGGRRRISGSFFINEKEIGWEFCINPEVIVTAIYISYHVDDVIPFYSGEKGKNQGKTFTIESCKGSKCEFTEIKAFYLPSTVYV